jgi:hypothetical protein
MPLGEVPYKTLRRLLKRYLDRQEHDETERLMGELAHVKKKGFLERGELAKIAYWKSPRVKSFISLNSPKKVKRVTRKAFATRNERQRIDLLTSLHGVGLPVASAILMLTHPKQYPVIDTRVWEWLLHYGKVHTNLKANRFRFREWEAYLEVIGKYAEELECTPRDIERTLYFASKCYQVGRLYDKK